MKSYALKINGFVLMVEDYSAVVWWSSVCS